MEKDAVKSLEQLVQQAKERNAALNEEVDQTLSESLANYGASQEATLKSAEELYEETYRDIKLRAERSIREQDEKSTQSLLNVYHRTKEEEEQQDA